MRLGWKKARWWSRVWSLDVCGFSVWLIELVLAGGEHGLKADLVVVDLGVWNLVAGDGDCGYVS